MPPVVTFIGYHDSGKTTLASAVVRHLQGRGYRVGVIKSTKDEGLEFDQPGTDTDTHRRAGAARVALVAPDQMVIFCDPPEMELAMLAHRFFPDMDIVIGEGFKHARHIAKIEVASGQEELLRETVRGVIAVVSDAAVAGDHVFRRSETRLVTDFIEQRFLRDRGKRQEKLVLLVDGRRIMLKDFVQDALAGTVAGFVRSLKTTGDASEIELRIRLE